MNKKERALFSRIFRIASTIEKNLNENNIEAIDSLLRKLEMELKQVTRELDTESTETKAKGLPIWRSFTSMTEEGIRSEFHNVEKYPNLNSIKAAVKGFLPMTKVYKVKTRETLINHIIRECQKREHIKEIGK